MNNKDVSNALSKFIKSSDLNMDIEINEATTNLQCAGKETICFYHITNHENSVQVFKDRFAKSECKNIILTKEIELEGCNVWVVNYKDFLEAQNLIANILYPNNQKLKVMGITGTNGKTTVSFLAMNLANQLGHPSISIGTIGIRSGDNVLEEDILSTTPSYLELRKIINKYQDDYKFIFMEVSSHALSQRRLYDIELSFSGWTSFSQDHLDYHKTTEDYFEAKLKILENSISKDLIVPSSEIELIEKLKSYQVELDIVEPIYNEKIDVGFKANYNQANLAVAKRIVERITNEKISNSELEKLTLPSGRFESIKYGDHLIIVDYAHTPDALENICRTIKEDFSEYHLRVVFGCGGDRDKSKRPLMGKAVASFADSIIVTSDNPRTEDPKSIIDDIIPGIGSNYIREEDRKKAILKAIDTLETRTVVLIAGKGHEEYQDIMGVKSHFSDREIVEDKIRERIFNV